MAEQRARNDDTPLCGIDEAGRGPLAGPVVAACVLIPAHFQKKRFWGEIRDSKKLTAKKREALYSAITEYACYGIALAGPEEIDALNIHHATLLAMRRAYEAMREHTRDIPQIRARVDGKFCPDIACPAQAVVNGDNLVREIGAASILAKVTRDRMMAELHASFPLYGWNHNAGYGTPEHLDAIKIHGITIHHRRSFAPVREAVA